MVTKVEPGLVQQSIRALNDSNVTLGEEDGIYIATLTTNDRTVTLPPVSGLQGKEYIIRRDGTGTNTLTVVPNGTDTVDDSINTLLHTDGECITLLCDESADDWILVRRDIPSTINDYTPSIVGFGTTSSVSFKWSRLGPFVKISGKFTAGTATAVEAQIPLPSGQTVRTGIPSNASVGDIDASGITNYNLTLHATAGDAFININRKDSSNTGVSPDTGSTIGSSFYYSVNAFVPIEGWNG